MAMDAGLWSPRRPHADSRLRADARGRDGDRINAELAAAGYNFILLLRWFEELLRVLSLILCHALATPLHLTRCRKTFFTADYFGFCETHQVLIALTRWVRLRLRAALWRQWKTPRRRRAALVAHGVSTWAARNTAGSGRGPWYLGRSRALSIGLSNAHFKSLGLPSLFQAC